MITSPTTYQKDRELFEELGLSWIGNSYGSEWKTLGTVERDDAEVTIEVSCLPAQFYRFTGHSRESVAFTLSTGSGALSDFWPVVEMFLDGMLIAS